MYSFVHCKMINNNKTVCLSTLSSGWVLFISQTWIFRGFSLFIINLTGRQLYKDGKGERGEG